MLTSSTSERHLSAMRLATEASPPERPAAESKDFRNGEISGIYGENAVIVAVAVSVGVGVFEGVLVGVLVKLGVHEGVNDGVSEGVGVFEGVNVGN
jgi:uncharacterized membrane protein